MPNAVLRSVCSISTLRWDYGQNVDFWNLPVKCSSRLWAKPHVAYKTRMIRNKSQIIRFFNLRLVCPNLLTNYLLTLNLSVSFFKLSAISRKSATCCVNSSIVARTSSEFAETSSVPAAFSCVEAEMLSSPSSTLP